MASNSDYDDINFQSSRLGTREFWEDSFKRDLHIYMETKEIDDIWFGQESVDRVLKWLKDNQISKSSSIIDIGCGNGATLLALASEGFSDLWGIDYSTSAIELSTTVCAHEQKNIKFQECDFLQDSSKQDSVKNGTNKDVNSDIAGNITLDNTNIYDKNNTETNNNNKNTNNINNKNTDNINNNTNNNDTTTTKTQAISKNDDDDNFLHRQYDVCLDKGTFDAICLNPFDRTGMKNRYKENLASICKHGGLFILTSCNWTRDELLTQFSSDFEFLHQIPTRTFQFGGAVGHGETVLVLKKI